MSRHHKGVLGFSILYTVLFVFDGVRWLSFLIPSAIASYLVYVVLALYGFFLFKDRLIQQWNEIRKTKRKFFFEVLKGWLLLFLMTILFALLSEILKQVLGLSGQGQNEASIQSAFKEQPLLIAVFACVIGPVVEEVFFRQIFFEVSEKVPIKLVEYLYSRTCLCPNPYAQFGFIRVDQCNLLLGWRLSLFYHLCERKRKYLLSLGRPYDSEQPLLYHFSYQ